MTGHTILIPFQSWGTNLGEFKRLSHCQMESEYKTFGVSGWLFLLHFFRQYVFCLCVYVIFTVDCTYAILIFFCIHNFGRVPEVPLTFSSEYTFVYSSDFYNYRDISHFQKKKKRKKELKSTGMWEESIWNASSSK